LHTLSSKSRVIVGLLLAFSLVQARGADAQSAERGKLLFLRCASCHDISETPSPKIGPNLRGVYGRKVASLPGFAYTDALKSQTFVWDSEHLNTWLTRPSAVAPGTAMAFAGISSEADRRAIIAYLRRPSK